MFRCDDNRVGFDEKKRLTKKKKKNRREIDAYRSVGRHTRLNQVTTLGRVTAAISSDA